MPSWHEWLLSRWARLRQLLQLKPVTRPQPPTKAIPVEREKLIQIGIDFGTSGTKIVYRDLQMRVARPIDFDHGVNGYPSHVLPSTVAIVDGRVFFGTEAESRCATGQVFRSFKVCLACQVGLTDCRRCAHVIGDSEPGVFRVICTGDPVIVDAQQLCTWYLAHAIRLAYAKLRQQWPPPWRLKIWINVGAPIDQYQGQLGKEVFSKAAYWAEKLSDDVRDGMSLPLLLEEYGRITASYPILPSEAQRKIFVLPETAAGLMSFVSSPAPPFGLYAIIDVGAGTIDISFFRLASLTKSDLRMVFYDARTAIIGADNIDRAVVAGALSKARSPEKLTPQEATTLLQEARLAKGMSNSTPIRLAVGKENVCLQQDDIAQLIRPILDEMLDTYRKSNFAAFRKEGFVERWRSYLLFFLGGGTRIDLLRKDFTTFRPSPHNRQILATPLRTPDDFEATKAAKSDFDLLAIAYGLSYPAVDFPIIYNPSEVEPLHLDFKR